MRERESGQAVVEYILMLALVVGVVGGIGYGFRKTIIGVWIAFSRDIAAACPTTCQKDTTNIQ